MRSGQARPENLLSDDELRSIEAPVLFVMGDAGRVRARRRSVERAAALDAATPRRGAARRARRRSSTARRACAELIRSGVDAA